MSTSLAIVMLLGLLANYLFTKIKLPGLFGMLLLGMCLGPHGLNWLDKNLLMFSSDFRSIALIIILLRAGIGIKKEDLQKVGVPALKMSMIPSLLEGFAIAFVAMKLWGFSFAEGGVLGFILAAVSPAVVVPAMLSYIDQGYGKAKSIPALILAGGSVDNVLAITIFSTFIGVVTGSQLSMGQRILNIPLSICLGGLVGTVVGLTLVHSFKRFHIRDTKKIMILLGTAIMLTALEKALKSKVEVAGLIGVMTIGFIIIEKSPEVGKRLALKLNKIWIFAEILVFVLVGAQVDMAITLELGLLGFAVLLVGLLFRSLGVWLSLLGTSLEGKEKLFCVVSYWPKATVQATVGAIPLSLGLPHGELYLALAVLAILVTAPLGAVAIQFFAPRCLKQG